MPSPNSTAGSPLGNKVSRAKRSTSKRTEEAGLALPKQQDLFAAEPAKKRRPSKLRQVEDSVPPDTSRNHLDWLEREDDAIMDLVMVDGSPTDLFQLSQKFKKDPVLVARHLLEGDLPDMVGLRADEGSEEEAEFLGLVLGGCPIALALRWCAACEDHQDRPTFDAIQQNLLRGDFRPAMNLVREAGIWFSGVDQLEYLVLLQDMETSHVRQAVEQIMDRIDAPHPKMVFEQLCGLFEGEPEADWDQILFQAPSRSWGRKSTSSRTSTTKVIKAGQSHRSRKAKSSSSSSTKKKTSSKRAWFGYAKKKRS